MATGKLRELAAISDMPSAPTLRAFIQSRPDFPVLKKGRKGVEYLFDLEAAAAFVRANWRDRRCELSGIARCARDDRRRLITDARQSDIPGIFGGQRGSEGR